MPELRKDPVVGRWVIISTERSRRPTSFTPVAKAMPTGFCPFCPGNEDKTPNPVFVSRQPGAAPGGSDWAVRVVPNKFPALQIEGGLDRRGEGLYDRMNGVGAHEVIIESPDHQMELADLPVEHIAQVLLAYRERILDLRKDTRLRYVLIFKNHGQQAGATLEHTHSQLIATPIIPRFLQEELEGARRYYELKERCVFCDIVHQETADNNGRRVVAMNDRFVALEPFAPRFPFETWILPLRHDASYQESSDLGEYLELAALLRDTLQRLNRALDRPPYNFVLHTAPVGDSDLEYYHWHIEIMPNLTRVAGFEMGSGFHINPTPPEDAAQYLREIAAEGPADPRAMTERSTTIVHFASEMTPLAKAGGLGDVIGALAAEQARRGHRVTVALPAYRALAVPAGWTRHPQPGCDVPWGLGVEPAGFEILRPPAPPAAGPGHDGAAGPSGGSLEVLLVEHRGERRFFDREGIYDDPARGQSYPDGAERFMFFARATLQALARRGDRIDILHAHDHQAGWVPCFARTHLAAEPSFAAAATVFTIHNLGYQGIHDPWVLGLAGFGRELFYPAGPFEFFGRVNDMKVGLLFADLLSTVSPRYAREIQSGGEFGFGLEGVLQRRSADLRGILNGIDDAIWDPARDRFLPNPYDREHPEGKVQVRAALREECGFPVSPDWPLVGTVTRLVEQKGLDLIEQAEADLLRLDARFVILGAGQPRFQELLTRLMIRHPQRFYYRAGFDERFAHLIEGGCDLFLMPSRYEPCGLNQMYSLRYGTLPVVRATGGLADTVEDFDVEARTGTGFVFQRYEAAEMVAALRRGLTAWRQPAVRAGLMRRGMSLDFSWRASADGYDRLYADALARVRQGGVPTLDSVRASI